MKIAVNTIPLLGPKTGVGNYIWNICRDFERSSDSLEMYYYSGNFSRKLAYGKQNSKLLCHVKDLLRKVGPLKVVLRHMRNLRARTNRHTFDLYFEPNFIPQNLRSRYLAVTVHDFSFHLYPNWHPAERVNYFRKAFWKNISRADAVITVSNFVRDQAVSEFGFDPGRVHVIPNGFDQDLFRPLSVQERAVTRQRLALPEHFVLFVGSIEPRKNLVNLLDAYASLPQELRARVPLVLAGFSGWENKAIMDRLHELRGQVRYMGFVEDRDLAALYALADLFVYPSFYEGFGLPPLEAMACGCPVLVSDTSSLPEVCGEAALYTSPDNVEEMAHRIRSVLEDAALGQDLCNKGLQQAEQYSWHRSAQMHMKLFRSFL